MEQDGLPLTDLIEGKPLVLDVSEELAELKGLMEPEQAAPKAGPAPEPVAKQEWIHEPSGKGFETELDMLRYESGWKSNKMGELRAQVEMIDKLAAKGKDESPSQPNQLTQEQMERNLVALALNGTGIKADEADPAYATIARMTENLIGAYDGIMEKKLAALQTKLDNFEAQTNESNAIAGAGIDKQTIENILEKHPGLKAMPINDRVAVIAALAKGGGEKPTNALRDKLQPDPASHVEGSANNEPTMTGEAAVMKKAGELSDADLLRILGESTAAGPKPWDQNW